MAGEVGARPRPQRTLAQSSLFVRLVELSPASDGRQFWQGRIATITGHGLRDLRSISTRTICTATERSPSGSAS
jgi:hypothetical protein